MSNPILNEKNFNEQARVYEGAFMTVNGTIQVAVFLALILVCRALSYLLQLTIHSYGQDTAAVIWISQQC